MSMTSSQRPSETHMWLNKLVLLHVQQNRTHRIRNHGVTYKKESERTFYRIGALMDNLGEGLRKRDWMLPENGNISMCEYPHKSYPERGKMGARLKL